MSETFFGHGGWKRHIFTLFCCMVCTCMCVGMYAQEAKADKWIVVTTIHYPTPALIQLSQLQGWKLVVVADKKTPSDWYLEGCDFLSVERQQGLGYSIIKCLPWNHYSRKNIGYLWAIAHGAKVIYDTDDDNLLYGDIPFLRSEEEMLTCATVEPVWNVYAHFGQPSVWPRGFPLQSIQTAPCQTMKYGVARPLVQQMVVDNDPDVDAIFRLTRPLPVMFQRSSPPLCLPQGTFCPFNSQSTLFQSEAFWGLVLPITPAFRVCDIWRGYWVQRLLWDIGGNLCFAPPVAYQERNVHNFFSDYVNEQDLYLRSHHLIAFLATWRSDSPMLFDRIRELTHDLVGAGFFKPEEEKFIEAWVEDLSSVGYELESEPEQMPGIVGQKI